MTTLLANTSIGTLHIGDDSRNYICTTGPYGHSLNGLKIHYEGFEFTIDAKRVFEGVYVITKVPCIKLGDTYFYDNKDHYSGLDLQLLALDMKVKSKNNMRFTTKWPYSLPVPFTRWDYSESLIASLATISILEGLYALHKCAVPGSIDLTWNDFYNMWIVKIKGSESIRNEDMRLRHFEKIVETTTKLFPSIDMNYIKSEGVGEIGFHLKV